MTFHIQRAKQLAEEFTKKFEELRICPYCNRKMEIGSMSAFEIKYGCYKDDCEDFIKEGYHYTRDLSFEDNRLRRIKDQIAAYEDGYNDALKSNSELSVGSKPADKDKKKIGQA